MFLFKKTLAPIFFPLSLCLGFLLLGLFLLWATRSQLAGKIFVTLGTGLLVLLSYPPLPNLLLRPLESKYPPFDEFNGMSAKGTDIRWIVVLDGDEGAFLSRVVEGVRLYRQIPRAKLLMSGGTVFGFEAGAVGSARVAKIMGVKPEDLVIEAESRDTEEQARQIGNLLGEETFILVTSASHMPRAVALFQKVGLDPIPAPTGHLVKARVSFSPGSFFPDSRNLLVAETAIYEYLGLTWAWLRGVI